MTTKHSARFERRRDPSEARKVIEQRIPDAEQRRVFLEALAAIVQRAHALRERSWSVSLFARSLRVNVGRVMVLELLPTKPCLLCVDKTLVSREMADELESLAVSVEYFRLLPDHPCYSLPLPALLELLPKLHDAMLGFVDLAATTAKSCPYSTSYSPGVLEYAEEQLGIELPRAPESELAGTQGKDTELEDLFEEFVETYVDTEKGQAHLETYPRQRLEATRNWTEIKERKAAGEDVTDLVLSWLLPHGNSRGNRERGAWTHIAPAVTKDVRSWFEGAGWTKAEDWPEVARAILRFVSESLESPESLAEACDEFAANPLSKGFQSGMLSPILNALDPESFAITNSKVVKVTQYYTGTKLGARLDDYAAINELVQQFVEQHEDLFARDTMAGARPGDVFDQLCHWLVAEKDGWPPSAHGDQEYWKISPGEKARLWDECHAGGYICIGWSRLGNLANVTRDEFDTRVAQVARELDGYTVTATNQVWNFAQIPVGAYVVANRGHREIVGVGRVTGAYGFHEEGDDYPHRLPVDWYDIETKPIDCRGWNKTMVRLDRGRFLELGCKPQSGETSEADSKTSVEPTAIYTIADCAEETGFSELELRRWIRAIERKGQAIFYGPPGTGKTYMAERLAKVLVGGGNGSIDLVQFHPSYAYEDFVQGIRPTTGANGSLTFEKVPGRFLEFCKRVESSPDTSVLIIDEINRAELSRVFGELMYLLEYRDKEVPLAGGDVLRIPKNLRIIGAMNTADRSIALVDHALRRRFAFFPLHPREDILVRYHDNTGFPIQGLVKMLRQVNEKIGDPNYSIGISFFLTENLERQIEDIWSMEIIPYLEEFFFDQDAAVDGFRWERVCEQILP